MNRIIAYLNYYFNAQTALNIHSPEMYEIANEVIDNHEDYYAFERIETLRHELLTDHRMLEFTDFGVKTGIGSAKRCKVSSIARKSLSKNFQCRQLFHWVRHTNSKHILELGTSLGISTLYLAAWDSDIAVHTLEGAASIAKIARENFMHYGYGNIHIHTGRFQHVLPDVLEAMESVDFVFIDGHHEGNACLNYYKQIRPYCSNQTVIVIDDIYWSDSMQNAWRKLIQEPEVRLSIDLFHYGVLMFSSESMENQHFTLIPKKLKPLTIPW